MKKLFALGTAAAIVALGGPLLVQAVTVNANTSNDVNVASCEQVGADIRIRQSANGQSSILTSACRDAGHGLRQYTMTCVSPTKYRVSWTDCSTPTPPAPADTQGPAISLSAAAVANSVNGVWYSYQVTVSAQDAVSNVKGIQVVVKNANNQVVQSWWVDNRNAWSTYEGGFGTPSVSRTVTRGGLRVGQNYTVTAQAFDVRGNSTMSSAANVYVSGDTVAPTITVDVTYSAQWYPGYHTKRMVPTLVVNAHDSQRIAKITLYYNNTGLSENYNELKTCTVNANSATCSHSFGDLTRGNFYATAWDQAGNAVSSYKIAF